jgi:hypothetical protein
MKEFSKKTSPFRFSLGGDLPALICVANLRLGLGGDQMLPTRLVFGFLQPNSPSAKQLLLRRRIVVNQERRKFHRVVDYNHIHTKDGQDEQMLISIRFVARAASDDAARRRSVGGHDGSDVHDSLNSRFVAMRGGL